jgi:broad specificity phosphatase PhoE
MKEVELRRHTANDGDVLTSDGVADAVAIGRRLSGLYEVVVSSGAQRATQTAGCFVAGLGEEVPGGIVVEPRLRSEHEDRWRELYRDAGAGDLGSLREVDAAFVDAEAQRLGAGLGGIFDRLSELGRALAVGHSPTNEAAVFGLTGIVITPMGKGEGVVVRRIDGGYDVVAVD